MFVGVFSGRSTRAATTRRAAAGRMNTLRAACQNPSRNSPKTPTAVRVALRSTTPAPPSTAAPAIIQRERVETGCSLVKESSKGVHQQARERREAPRRGVEHRDSLRRCRSLRRRVRAAGRAQAQCSQCRTAGTWDCEGGDPVPLQTLFAPLLQPLTYGERTDCRQAEDVPRYQTKA